MAMSGSGGTRNIVVTVSANTAAFTAGMTSVRSQLTGLQSSVAGTLGSISSGLNSISNQLILTGAAGTGFSQYLSRIFADALPQVEEYYQAQARLISLMDDGTKSYQQMSREAWEFAKAQSESSIFTATEVTKAMYIVAQAGYEGTEIQKVATATMNLATAQAYDFTQTTDDVIGILNAFKLEAGDATRITDLLAATLTASKMSMEDITYGAKYASVAFNAMGYSAEEAFTAMSLLTDLGYKGENAGRILRDSLADLMDPTAEAMEIINKHHIVLYDNQAEYDALVATYDSVSASVTDLKMQEESLTATMRDQQRYTENLNLEMQKLNLEADKIRLKYNEDNPMLKSLEREKDAIVTSRDAAKDYYKQLKDEQTARVIEMTAQKSSITNIRRQITAINNEMAANRSEGFESSSPRQQGLAEQKKALQDQLLEEQKTLDTMKNTHSDNNKLITEQKKKVSDASEALADQNKKIKDTKDELSDAERREINAIDRKKIAIEEEKIAQAEKYQLLQDQQQKVNDQLDEYNAKADAAKQNMENFVPTGLIAYDQLLRNINAARLEQGEMYTIFGKQSAPGMSDLTSDKTLEAWGTRFGKLVEGEQNHEATRQKESIVGSLYGQETIAKTKYDNTTLQAVQDKYDPLLAVIKDIADPQLLANITKIKTDMLGGVIKGVEDLLPVVKTGVDRMGGLNSKVWEAIGAFGAMTGAIMYVVAPALLTLGVFGSMGGMATGGLSRLLGGKGGAAVAESVAGAAVGRGGAGKAVSEVGSTVAARALGERGTKYSRGMELLGPDIFGNLERQQRVPYIGDNLIGNLENQVSSMSLEDRAATLGVKGKKISNFDVQSTLLGQQFRGRGASNDEFGDSLDDVLANMGINRATPISGKNKGAKDFAIADRRLDGLSSDKKLQIIKDVEDIEKKFDKTPKMKLTKTISGELDDTAKAALKTKSPMGSVINVVDDVAVATTRAAPGVATATKEVGLLGRAASIVAPLLGMGGTGVAAETTLAGGLAGVGIEGAASGGIIATLGTTIASLALPIAIIAAAAVGLYFAWTNNWLGIRDVFGGVYDFLIKRFGWMVGWVEGVKKSFEDSFGDMLEGLQEVWDGLANADLTQLVEGLAKISGTTFRMLAKIPYYAADFTSQMIENMIEGIIDGGPGFFEAMGAFMADIPNMLLSVGEVILFQAGNFGVSLIDALLGKEQTEDQKREQRNKVAGLLDSAFKGFGLESNLTGYVAAENEKRATRQLEKAQRESKKSQEEMDKIVQDGIKAGKTSEEILKDLGITYDDVAASNKQLGSGVADFTGIGEQDYSTLYANMDKAGVKTDDTKTKTDQLTEAANKPLLAPNYDQNKFNAFNANIEHSMLLLAQMQGMNAYGQVALPTSEQAITPAYEAVKSIVTPAPAPIPVTTPKYDNKYTTPPDEKGMGTYIDATPKNSGVGFGLSLATGMLAGTNPVIGAGLKIAGMIAGFFPQSPAKEGPLTKLPEMGEKIPEQIASGMLDGKTKIENATQVLASTIQSGLQAIIGGQTASNGFITADDGTKMFLQAPETWNGGPMKVPEAMSTPTSGRNIPWYWESQGATGVRNENFNFTFNGTQDKTDLTRFGKQLVRKVKNGRGDFTPLG